MHQVSGGAQGNISDVEIELEEMQTVNKVLMTVLAENTGMSLEEVKEHYDRDKWMSAEQAKVLGIIDKVQTSSTRGKNE
jgi:ATP-dependent Clp protease protease subunit